ncbi:hypothetical protein ACCO45_003694 [Purpureocillium lilacinum]|uniref:Uncharacterized protein n=1 Tax=Purpureocillium lilacinum TaxID=33203 RepID=A0ACC4E3E8_PURLI
MSTGAAAVQTPVHHSKPSSLVPRVTIHASRTESTCASGRAFAISSARRRTQPSGRTAQVSVERKQTEASRQKQTGSLTVSHTSLRA